MTHLFILKNNNNTKLTGNMFLTVFKCIFTSYTSSKVCDNTYFPELG